MNDSRFFATVSNLMLLSLIICENNMILFQVECSK